MTTTSLVAILGRERDRHRPETQHYRSVHRELSALAALAQQHTRSFYYVILRPWEKRNKARRRSYVHQRGPCLQLLQCAVRPGPNHREDGLGLRLDRPRTSPPLSCPSHAPASAAGSHLTPSRKCNDLRRSTECRPSRRTHSPTNRPNHLIWDYRTFQSGRNLFRCLSAQEINLKSFQ